MASPDPRTCFPIYILPEGRAWQVLISPGKRDMTHPALWKLCGARILAKRLGIAARLLLELPYACHRARVVDRTVFWGGDLAVAQRQALTAALREAGLPMLTWRLDAHEVRQKDDVERLAAHGGPPAWTGRRHRGPLDT